LPAHRFDRRVFANAEVGVVEDPVHVDGDAVHCFVCGRREQPEGVRARHCVLTAQLPVQLAQVWYESGGISEARIDSDDMPGGDAASAPELAPLEGTSSSRPKSAG
jgi:hypothetical protein